MITAYQRSHDPAKSCEAHLIDASSSLCRKTFSGTEGRAGRVLTRRCGGENVNGEGPRLSAATLASAGSTPDLVLSGREVGVMKSSSGDFGGEDAGEGGLPVGVNPKDPVGKGINTVLRAISPPLALDSVLAGLRWPPTVESRTCPRGVTTEERGVARTDVWDNRGERNARCSIFALARCRATLCCSE